MSDGDRAESSLIIKNESLGIVLTYSRPLSFAFG